MRRTEIGFVVTLTLGMAVCTFLPYALGALGPFITDDLGITRTALGLGSAVSVVLFASVVLIAAVFIKGFGVDLARARGEG